MTGSWRFITVPRGKSGKVIKKIKFNKKAIAIIFSDGERIDISEEAYTSSYLYVGKELTQKDIDKLTKISSVKKLSEYAISLLTKGHYTEWKMREKLYAKGGEKEAVDFVIQRLKDIDLINDKAFIEDYLGYAEEKGYGKNKIKQELLKKGIFAEEIAKIRFNITSEKKKAAGLVKGLEKKYAKYSYQQKRQHVYAALISRGFDPEVANYALSFLSEKDEKDEKKKLKEDFKKIYNRFAKKYEGRELKERVYRSLISKGYKYGDISELLGGMDNDF